MSALKFSSFSRCCRFAALQSCGYSGSLPLCLHSNKSTTIALHPIFVGNMQATVQIWMKFSFVFWFMFFSIILIIKELPDKDHQLTIKTAASVDHFHAPLHFSGKENSFWQLHRTGHVFSCLFLYKTESKWQQNNIYRRLILSISY